MNSSTDHLDRFQPLALLLGAVLPGLGQWFLGFRARGALIGGGVLGLFFAGVFMGGLNSVDSRENRIWFIGQALIGPVAFGVDRVHQTMYRGVDPRGNLRSPDPGETLIPAPGGGLAIATAPAGTAPPIVKSLGRPNELGVLFAAIAGMLNLIVLVDAAFSCTRRERDEFIRDQVEQEAAKARMMAQAAPATLPVPPAAPSQPAPLSPAATSPAPLPGAQA